MLRPEQIANRREASEGKEMVFENKEALVEHLIELAARTGKNVTQEQRKRYMAMRRDQLEVLISNFGKEAPKKEVAEEVAPKKEAPKNAKE